MRLTIHPVGGVIENTEVLDDTSSSDQDINSSPSSLDVGENLLDSLLVGDVASVTNSIELSNLDLSLTDCKIREERESASFSVSST